MTHHSSRALSPSVWKMYLNWDWNVLWWMVTWFRCSLRLFDLHAGDAIPYSSTYYIYVDVTWWRHISMVNNLWWSHRAPDACDTVHRERGDGKVNLFKMLLSHSNYFVVFYTFFNDWKCSEYTVTATAAMFHPLCLRSIFNFPPKCLS